MNDTKDVVYFHAPCVDGWVAALAAWLKLGDGAHYHPWFHGAGTTPLRARTVYFLDLCPPTRVIEDYLAAGSKVVVLDHHASAQRLVGEIRDLEKIHPEGQLLVAVDLGASGALMAWRQFHPRTEIPWLVRYVDDRDRWVWALPHSREISCMLDLLSFDSFTEWRFLLERMEDETERNACVLAGESILAAKSATIRRQVETAKIGRVLGHEVPVVNVTAHRSETLHELAKAYPHAPFSAGYYDVRGTRYWSLRSEPDRGFDVSKLAEEVGGGGHALAAGFCEGEVFMGVERAGS